MAEYRPDHDELFELAFSQAGYFTTAQAQACGFSDQLIQSHLKTGNFERVRRGIYRYTKIPPDETGDLVAHWLWSRQEGIFSHQTVLVLNNLSDVLPSKAHMTLPGAQERDFNRKTPKNLVLHFSDVPPKERKWFGPVPVTSVARAIRDCIEAHEVDDIIEQAIDDADERGMLRREERELCRALLVLRRHRGT